MCGIAGFVGGDNWNADQAISTLIRMNYCLKHRGPDRSDIWIDQDAGVALAHNRLSIVDLSAAGNQPMRSHSGRFVIIYNGEIYNHQAIRKEMAEAGHLPNWNGRSDTETLLASIELWGLPGALERAVGMFAFALWDNFERSLVLARDRLGEKPLYYGRQFAGGPFLFGSELKALAQHPQFRGEVDRRALGLLLRYGYIPAPLSIYTGLFKLSPGTFLTLADRTAEPEIEIYWSGTQVTEAKARNPLQLGQVEAICELERLLESAVGQQMVADVPIGAFLSGGVDSSAIVAIMQNLSSRPVKTFTIGFREKGYDEATHAKAVARHLGTDHTELYVTSEEARAVLPRLPSIYDEPFADSSQIPTYLVASLARRQVTVALSGDGGDEMFGGYNRYVLTSHLWDKIEHIPRSVRTAAARLMTALPLPAWNRLGDAAGGMLPHWAKVDRFGEKVRKGALLLDSGSVSELYGRMRSLWQDSAAVVIGTSEPEPAAALATGLCDLGAVQRMMLLDMISYLPDDILTKVDRAAMAVSLETRIPYLDHRVVEFACSLPLDLKVRNGRGKWILRQLLYRLIPPELIERPKTGFSIPLGPWLAGPLRDWVESLIDERKLREEGFFRSGPLRDVWSEHLSGRIDEQARLWPVLMFQSWLSVQGKRPLLHETISPELIT
jgi:asparagine synthase (glutamine-hydrolysing)